MAEQGLANGWPMGRQWLAMADALSQQKTWPVWGAGSVPRFWRWCAA
jgi:hypothetical protein